MTIIELEAIMKYADGSEDFFGGETGSAEFYMIKHTLQEHLDQETKKLLYYTNDLKESFIIETETAENIYDYIDIIQSISQAFDQDRRLRFEIVNVE
jgi:hypothetical protein